MTIDELEREYQRRNPVTIIDDFEVVDDTLPVFTRKPDLDGGYGSAIYDIAYGVEITALMVHKICPQCGEPVEYNRDMTLHDDGDNLYYDCTHAANHRYLVQGKDFDGLERTGV